MGDAQMTTSQPDPYYGATFVERLFRLREMAGVYYFRVLRLVVLVSAVAGVVALTAFGLPGFTWALGALYGVTLSDIVWRRFDVYNPTELAERRKRLEDQYR